jgi:phosphatidylglycerophosphate synthase
LIEIAMHTTVAPRRILATRNAAWAVRCAHRVGQAGVTPNAVSIAGAAIALCTSAAFALAPAIAGTQRAALLVAAAAGIQLRLLCNLLDGMLAVEEGLKSRTGEIYNELPDRIADVVILVGAGYSVRQFAFGPILGWTAAVCAVFTAFIRVLAASLRTTQHFVGPMAKQHRMFTLTVGALAAAVEARFAVAPRAIGLALSVIVVGSIVTAIRRTRLIAAELEAR